MQKEIELWNFIAERLAGNDAVVLMVVAKSSGSSPGRTGFKMAVTVDEFCGSIGGGVMEVALVEKARAILETGPAPESPLVRQVHRKNSEHGSGMICSGEQTVIAKKLELGDSATVKQILDAFETEDSILRLTNDSIGVIETVGPGGFEETADGAFNYEERIGQKNELYIVGGGHCALALSEIMSKLEFRINVFDDRPNLNTLAKNEFADNVAILESYKRISESIPAGDKNYVVVMTLGFKYDKVVIKELISKDFKYFGVLGSKAKMAVLINELIGEGFDLDRLKAIRTPIGLDINSRTPEEIAVSIAAEIISVKNGGKSR